MTKTHSFVPLILGFLALSACAHKTISMVGLSDSDHSFVRVISSQSMSCPTVKIQGAQNQELSLKSEKFDAATVCEASLPPGTQSVQTPAGLIQIPQTLNHVVLMGDTGCRLHHGVKGGPIQKCDDPKEWPFPEVIKTINRENADLILHVGDYHYRELCVDPAACGPYLDTVTYGFKGWEADFMNPAASLLQQRPWIFIRGNHEDCQRAHEGFDRLLGPVEHHECEVDQPTHYISFGNLLIVNFDMGSVADKPYEKNSAEYKKLKQRYLAMLEVLKTRPEKEIWFVSHKPIWGIAPVAGSLIPTNLNLQNVVDENPMPEKVTLALAGHIHDFQLARGTHPLQLVVGESGTALDSFSQKASTMHQLSNGVQIFAPTTEDHEFGYVILDREAQGWKATIKDQKGQAQYTCNLWDAEHACVPAH